MGCTRNDGHHEAVKMSQAQEHKENVSNSWEPQNPLGRTLEFPLYLLGQGLSLEKFAYKEGEFHLCGR